MSVVHPAGPPELHQTVRGKGSPPRVIYWNNQASPYFVRRMNVLHERGNIAIQAWFCELRTRDRAWSVDPHQWRFRAQILPPGPRRLARSIALLRKEKPDVLVSLFEDYAFASTAVAAKAARIPVAIHAMRTFPLSRQRSLLREAAKHALFRIVDAVQVSGPESRAYAEDYGAASRRIFGLREEIDLAFWSAAADARGTQMRTLRSPQGTKGCVFLYVGRLCRSKGIDSLIEAYAALRASSIDCSLVLVGAGPDEKRLRACARSIDAVVFAGHVEGEALRSWYSAADVFVFPTLGDSYGHVVQEAMASGLPVISTTAAGDIRDRVIEGQTGYLVPPDDAHCLAHRMRQLARDPGLRARLGLSGKERIQDWSTELWASRFEQMIYALLKSRSGT